MELFSQLAAVLMPQMPACELFRSFPRVVGEEDLEPILTAYGSLKDPKAALFVLYDGEHGKRDGMNHEFQQTLLAYGPPASHILHISHTESRPLEDRVLCVKVRVWDPGDKVSFSEALSDLTKAISMGLGSVLCQEVLWRLQNQKDVLPTLDAERFIRMVAVKESAATDLKRDMNAKGFGKAGSQRLQKCARLTGKCFEAKLCSRIQWLLNLNQSQSQLANAIAPCSPLLDRQKTLEQTRRWLLDSRLAPDQVERVSVVFPLLVASSIEQNLAPTVQWLLDLGLSKRQVVKVIRCYPQALGSTIERSAEQFQDLLDLGLTKKQTLKILVMYPDILGQNKESCEAVRWLHDFGMTEGQIARLISRSPQSLSFSKQHFEDRVLWLLDLGMTKKQIAIALTAGLQILSSREETLRAKAEWLLNFGLTRTQVGKVIVGFPGSLCCSIERNIKPKMNLLLDFGLSKAQVAQIIALSPQILGYSMGEKLKPTMEWLQELGLTQAQVAKAIAAYPRILGLSLEENLKPKVLWLLELGLSQAQVAKTIATFPSLFGCSMDKNLNLKVQWLLDFGLTRNQISKVIAAFPPVLSYRIEENLKPKVEWLLSLGLTKSQVVKVISTSPSIFGCSISKNLSRKKVLLQNVLGDVGAADVVLKRPVILGLSYRRLSSRLEVLVAQNATDKLASAMQMTEGHFKARYLKEK